MLLSKSLGIWGWDEARAGGHSSAQGSLSIAQSVKIEKKKGWKYASIS